MKCGSCGRLVRKNLWVCPECSAALKGGVVFVTAVSGSATGDYMGKVLQQANAHGHPSDLHDIGIEMRRHATEHEPDVQWDAILDADEGVRRYLRALAFKDLTHDIKMNPEVVHLVDLHLSFRWRAYLTKGFEPHILEQFVPYVRCFVNLIEDLPKIKERLSATAWGDREILELLVWRDEELFLTNLFAETCGRVDSYAIAAAEPPSMLERLIWHPEVKRVYLSFPITALRGRPDGEAALREVEAFRDRMREFLVVFDPFACRDYDETYAREEMKALRKQVGEATEERDYRFIDQANAVVVYFPRMVSSKGVDAEMNHARRTGKPIYLYAPEKPREGPFVVPPKQVRSNPDEFIELLKAELPPDKPTRAS